MSRKLESTYLEIKAKPDDKLSDIFKDMISLHSRLGITIAVVINDITIYADEYSSPDAMARDYEERRNPIKTSWVVNESYCQKCDEYIDDSELDHFTNH